MAPSRVFGFLVILLVLHAQASEATKRPNPVAILKKSGNFNTLLSLLYSRGLVKPLNKFLKTSDKGVTLFAPTDNAFKRLPPGTLEKLTPQQQTVILLLHAAPKYYSYSGLRTARNPLRTFAPGLTLNVTVNSKGLFVSSGVVTTRVKRPIYSKSRLSIFRIDAVLIPRG